LQRPLSCFVGRRRPPTSTPFPYTTLFRSLVMGTHPTLAQRLAQTGQGHADLRTRTFLGRRGEVQIRQLLQQAMQLLAAQRLGQRSEEHTSELQSRENLVCRLLLEKKKPSH